MTNYPVVNGGFISNTLVNDATINIDVERTLKDKLSDVISVKDFGAVGDGVTDDTSSFIKALNYLVQNNGGKLYVPTGHYIISSKPDTSNNQNSIIQIPTVSTQVEIELCGDGNTAAFSGTPVTGTLISCPNTNGTIANGITPSVFGYGTSATDTTDTISWNLCYIKVKNLSVRVEPNSNYIPFDFSAISNTEFDSVSVFTNVDPSKIVAPTITTFSGIKLPFTGNYGIVKAKNVYVSGFYYGIEHCEHADIEALINYCVYALRIPMSYSHLAKYKVTTQYCSYSVRCDGLNSSSFGFANSIFGTLDIERDPNFVFGADFYINENCILNGTLFYNVAADPQSLYSVWGSGKFNVAVQNVAYHSLEVTSSTTVNPNGLFYPVIPNNLTSDITLTIRQGLVKGQIIRIYGYYEYNVTINSIVTTGSPIIYFSDNTSSYSYVIPKTSGGPMYIDMLWNGQDWFAATNNADAKLSSINSSIININTDISNYSNKIGYLSSDGSIYSGKVTGSVTGNILNSTIGVESMTNVSDLVDIAKVAVSGSYGYPTGSNVDHFCVGLHYRSDINAPWMIYAVDSGTQSVSTNGTNGVALALKSEIPTINVQSAPTELSSSASLSDTINAINNILNILKASGITS